MDVAARVAFEGGAAARGDGCSKASSKMPPG